MKYAIGIDLGGTRIKSALINRDGQILEQHITETGDDPSNQGAAWKQAIAAAVEKIKKSHPDVAIGISAPGLPNEQNSCISFMPGRMQGLENFSWSHLLGQPAYVLNDAVAALVAEARFGAAKGRKHAVLITLGTGVGGAILVDGKPYQGSFSKAGHIGHMVIDQHGSPDVCGMPGSLEYCIGNYSIPDRSGGRFHSTREMIDAFRQGDEQARSVWLTSVRQLALGLASITNILSPELIVIGGGIAETGNDLFEPLANYMEQFEWRAGGNRVEIVKAHYGDIAGTVGAASFAFSKSGLL